MNAGAAGARNYSQCDSLLIGSQCGAHTFPDIQRRQPDRDRGTRGDDLEDQRRAAVLLQPEGARARRMQIGLIVNGYAHEVLSRLPMEIAVEATKLLQVSLEGSVG